MSPFTVIQFTSIRWSLVALAMALSSLVSNAALVISTSGKLEPPLPEHDDRNGTPDKWVRVQKMLGPDANRVVLKQLAADLGGSTSVRNDTESRWKTDGYFQRGRDLGQVFVAPKEFTLESIVLRTGNSDSAFKPGTAGANVFVQFFEVEGDPSINDNGTPPGTDAKHGFSKNHRCDDFIEGVTYRSLRVVRGGRLPDLTAGADGKLTYMRWSLTGEDRPSFEKGKRYAFMVGITTPSPGQNFTLANRNNASLPGPPRMVDPNDQLPGGWGLRREGDGTTPPTMFPGETPPTDPQTLGRLKAESTFPEADARFELQPTSDGYPDVDTYRDLEFYLIESE